ncbi:hypothetical protein GQ53DRAFT_824244 [Thozetella sp. PMI_491]|nr:hypothetical protein GQ53DRAFT_824244 [Thozetella sp. PMI_491]
MADSAAANNSFRSERSNSASSAGSAPSPRRGSSGLFESLQAQKRNPDPAHMARRQSLHDQRPEPGVFGKMWNNWVHGTTSQK